MVKVRKDLTGKIFGRLTVIEQAEDYITPKGVHYSKWKCKCSCGNSNYVYVTGNGLHNGDTKSCGCLFKEMGKNNKKYNKYEFKNGCGIGYTLKGEIFYFDEEDYDKIKDICWFKDPKSGYIKGGGFSIHRVIMDCPNDKVVDHLGGEESRYDNRKNNLRIISQGENTINRATQSNNTSGCTGVSWSKVANKWQARITFDKKIYHLGCFNDFNEAVKVRKEAENKYFDELSYENSQKLYKERLTPLTKENNENDDVSP